MEKEREITPDMTGGNYDGDINDGCTTKFASRSKKAVMADTHLWQLE